MYIFWLNILILSMSCAINAQAASPRAALKLTDYLTNFVSDDENLNTEILKLDSARKNFERVDSHFASRLEVTPTYTKNNLKTPSLIDITDHRKSVTASYLQSSPWGSSIKLEVQRFFENSNPDLEQLNNEFSLSLEQSLWKDSFGSLTRLRSRLAMAGVEAQQKTLALGRAGSCIAGVSRYLGAYRNQRRVAILRSQRQLSNRALRVSEKTFNKRLSRKIDIIGARADSMHISSIFMDAQASHRKSILHLYRSVGQAAPVKIVLSRPQINFFKKNTPLPEGKNPQLITGQAKIVETELANQAVKQENRSTINLGVQIGQRDGKKNLSGILSEFDENFAMVYLKMQWPVLGGVRTKNLEISENNLRITKLNFKKIQEQEITRQEQIKVDLENLKNQIGASKKKAKLFKQQVDESLKLLNNGRIEFSDYQRSSDLLLAEKLRLTEFENNQWQLNMQWGLMSGLLDQKCGGLL